VCRKTSAIGTSFYDFITTSPERATVRWNTRYNRKVQSVIGYVSQTDNARPTIWVFTLLTRSPL
jgi:hypothetical protein